MHHIKQFIIDMLMISPFALAMVACTVKSLEWEAQRSVDIAIEHQAYLASKEANHDAQ